MKNPYEVLGINENATDEQVKEAYRNLARKYQADNYEKSSLAGVAEKKMKEIDEAYDEIILQRRSVNGKNSGSNNNSYSSSSGYASNNGTEYSNNYSGNSYSQYNDIRSQISNNRIDDAETLLDGIPSNMRDAEWYYLKGTIQYRRGWFAEASKNFEIATSMAPNNQEYRAAYNNINGARRNNSYRRTSSNRNNDCSGCDICCSLLCADSCCECCGGDLIPCC